MFTINFNCLQYRKKCTDTEFVLLNKTYVYIKMLIMCCTMKKERVKKLIHIKEVILLLLICLMLSRLCTYNDWIGNVVICVQTQKCIYVLEILTV